MPSASTHSVIHTDSPLSEMSGTRSSEGSGSCGRGEGEASSGCAVSQRATVVQTESFC